MLGLTNILAGCVLIGCCFDPWWGLGLWNIALGLDLRSQWRHERSRGSGR